MAIFGKGNDNSGLLHQILRELGELRERVTGQQHAIDQIRHDTTAAISTGLTETRAVVRDGLTRHQETIGDPLARIGSELVALRAGISDLGHGSQQHGSAADSSDEPEIADDKQPEQDASKLLKAAAGISFAEIGAHRDTWAFIVKYAGQDQHFHIPGHVAEEDGIVKVRISGPSIVAALTSLDNVSRTAGDPGTRAIADHLHQRLTDTVKEIIKNPQRGGNDNPVTIIIDDRAKPPADED